jgi:rubrerythrin
VDLIIGFACVLAIAVIAYILGVRRKDLPEPEPVSPFQHLDERKAAIYDNLRDLQFEYRVGKLSDEDYQSTKKDLQTELAAVMAEVDKIKAQSGIAVPAAAPESRPATPSESKPAAANPMVCPSCGTKFETAPKFCAECGQPLKAVKA